LDSKATIAFIGVHGVGKTRTAEVLSRMGYVYQPLEVIDEAYGLNPLERQLLFFLSFTGEYLKALKRYKTRVVFDSHPLIVIPYTEYWLRKAKYSWDEITRLIRIMLETILVLPKIDLLVYIKPRKYDTVVKRLYLRRRFNVEEEANPEYIEYIDRRVNFYVDKYADRIASRTITIDAEVEVEERARIVYEMVLGKSIVTALSLPETSSSLPQR